MGFLYLLIHVWNGSPHRVNQLACRTGRLTSLLFSRPSRLPAVLQCVFWYIGFRTWACTSPRLRAVRVSSNTEPVPCQAAPPSSPQPLECSIGCSRTAWLCTVKSHVQNASNALPHARSTASFRFTFYLPTGRPNLLTRVSSPWFLCR